MGGAACLAAGYLIGSMNPAHWLSKQKHLNLREHGSGNLGATNTMLVMGLPYGILVVIFDVLKTLFAHRVARLLCPHLYVAGLIGACGAILGHIFPFYLKFQGGKGVACLAGTIFTYDFGLFLVLVALGAGFMLIFNYGIAAPISAAFLFPLFVLARTKSIWMFALTETVSLVIIGKHRDNFRRIRNGEEIQLRAYFTEKLRPKCLPQGEPAEQEES